jgi:hypothetical protein
MNEETLKTAKKISADLAEAYKALGIWAEITHETDFYYIPNYKGMGGMRRREYPPELPGINKNTFHIIKSQVVQSLEAEIANCKELIRQL